MLFVQSPRSHRTWTVRVATTAASATRRSSRRASVARCRHEEAQRPPGLTAAAVLTDHRRILVRHRTDRLGRVPTVITDILVHRHLTTPSGRTPCRSVGSTPATFTPRLPYLLSPGERANVRQHRGHFDRPTYQSAQLFRTDQHRVSLELYRLDTPDRSRHNPTPARS